MSGGKRIDDHKFFAGGMSKDSVLPTGVHVKHEMSANSGGHETYYEDTTEAIRKTQDSMVSKMKGHKSKDGYRT